MIRLKPMDLSTIYQTTKLGTFKILWQKDGKEEKILNVKFDLIVMIRCLSVTKAIAKKDIHNIKIRIEKKLNFDFPNIELFIKEEKEHPNIKILNLSKNVPNSGHRKSLWWRNPLRKWT